MWLTSDDKVIVIHGGDDGEMEGAGEGQQPAYIFDLTFEEVKARFKTS